MERSRPKWCSTRQTGRIVTCSYSGGRIVSGPLIALVDAEGRLDMRYHPMNDRGELMTGVCRSTPELHPDGRIRLRPSTMGRYVGRTYIGVMREFMCSCLAILFVAWVGCDVAKQTDKLGELQKAGDMHKGRVAEALVDTTGLMRATLSAKRQNTFELYPRVVAPMGSVFEYLSSTCDILYKSSLSSSNGWLAVGGNVTRSNDVSGARELVHIYRSVNERWRHHQTIERPSGGKYGQWGKSLELFGDWLAVANRTGDSTSLEFNKYSGYVDMYHLEHDQWVFRQRLDHPFAEANGFGAELSLNGQYLAVAGDVLARPDLPVDNGILHLSRLVMYRLTERGAWEQMQVMDPFEDPRTWPLSFASRIDMNPHGELIVGDPMLSQVTVLEVRNGKWEVVQRVSIPGIKGLGMSVDARDSLFVAASSGVLDPIHPGATAAVGSAFIFRKAPAGQWVLHQEVRSPSEGFNEQFAQRAVMNDGLLALASIGGKQLPDATEPSPGLVYLYRLEQDGFMHLVQEVNAAPSRPDDWFGLAMCLSDEGHLVATTNCGLNVIRADGSTTNVGRGVHIYRDRR